MTATMSLGRMHRPVVHRRESIWSGERDGMLLLLLPLKLCLRQLWL